MTDSRYMRARVSLEIDNECNNNYIHNEMCTCFGHACASNVTFSIEMKTMVPENTTLKDKPRPREPPPFWQCIKHRDIPK